MSIVNDILNSVTGGGWDRSRTQPMPNATDEELLRLYDGIVNEYANAAALRDVEDGLRQYMDYNGDWNKRTMRNEALKRRGLFSGQQLSEIPQKSPTGKDLWKMLGIEDILTVPAKEDMPNIWRR